MAKKITEMGCAGGATVGPIQPLGVDKEKVDETLNYNSDLKHGHAVVFMENASYFEREDFRRAVGVLNYTAAGNCIREVVARQAIRQKMNEVVRKRKSDGKYVLYAPNNGKKHDAKPVQVFSSKLAAKRAELAKFPPKDPKKLERLRKQVEKLLKDPKARAKAALKENVDRDLFERALISSALLHEYKINPKSLSKKAASQDQDYSAKENNLSKVTGEELNNKLKQIEEQLGMTCVAGQPEKRKDGSTWLPFMIKADIEIKPVYLHVDEESRIKVKLEDEAWASLTQCNPEQQSKIRSTIGMLGEAPEDVNQNIAQAKGERDGHLDNIASFLDNFVAKLSPLALTSLKKLLVKKFREQGTQK